MKAAMIWFALILTALTSSGIGFALGIRPEIKALEIAKFLGEWQNLIGAFTTIFAVAATLQAGWWALSGPREQIRAAREDNIKKEERRYQSTRSITLINLNKITHFSIDALKYIYDDHGTIALPELDQNVIDGLAQLVMAGREESSEQAKSLIGEIQLVHSWIYDIHAEKASVSNAVPTAALHCLILHAKCMNWYDFSRGKEDSIADEVRLESIRSAIRIFQVRKDMEFLLEEENKRGLNLAIAIHFKLYDEANKYLTGTY